MKRQTFLTTTMVGATTASNAPLQPSSMLHGGANVAAYGAPAPFESATIRRPNGLPSPAMTPLDRQLGIVTPAGLHFVRNHAGVPAIDPHGFRLYVDGHVRRPLAFTLADLMRFPSVSRFHFLECAGNTAPGYEAFGTTVQFSHGLASCTLWTGVPLALVLNEAGVEDDAGWAIVGGADGAAFERSIPLANVRDDALLAYGQNGEALRPEQGYPLRLIVPGFEGSANVKWVRRIALAREPAYTREETARYAVVQLDGKKKIFDFAMPVKSVIVDPSPGRRLMESGWYEARGFAWSGNGKIAAVDVSLDDGATWSRATLDGDVFLRSFTRFTFPFRWDRGELTLASRASDETGAVQPTLAQFVAARGSDTPYRVNHIATWRVGRDGNVGADQR